MPAPGGLTTILEVTRQCIEKYEDLGRKAVREPNVEWISSFLDRHPNVCLRCGFCCIDHGLLVSNRLGLVVGIGILYPSELGNLQP